ncbi:F-box domain-containing protein [Mycena indigotica]|uniref:F-box domain-containing protein n=1 Tax=Mycena indigotica TaxID=2126181 RepID=A0A8H6S4E9_9AGAR|nr:F-box domain-containing protein [Mycena indigotica]KAF7292237.1 F-box domain-containing protein [Mycena indigotica]
MSANPPSEAAAFLRNNDPPPQGGAHARLISEFIDGVARERTLVLEQIAGVKAALEQELEAATRRADAKIMKLETQKQQLTQIIQQHKGIISVVRRLPPSVIANIISHLLSMTTKRETPAGQLKPEIEQDSSSSSLSAHAGEPTPSTSWTLAVLTRVSRLWQQTTIENAQFWSTISLSQGYRDAPPLALRHPLSRLTTHIARSKQEPLELFIDFVHEDGLVDSESVHWKALMDVVVPTSGRWRRLALSWNGPTRGYLDDQSRRTSLDPFNVLETSPTRLDALEISSAGSRGFQFQDRTLNQFSRTVRKLCLHTSIPLLPVAWFQLTDLHCSYSLDILRQILCLVVNIHRCSFVVVSDPEPQPSSSKKRKSSAFDPEPEHVRFGTIVASLLEIKQLYIESPIPVDPLLSGVSMPNLEYLVLDVPFKSENTLEPSTRNLSMLWRSICTSLHGLRLTVEEAMLTNVLSIVRTQPHLAHLDVTTRPDIRFDRPAQRRTFIRGLQLSTPPKPDDACPRLETLALALPSHDPAAEKDIVAMLKSRTSGALASHSQIASPLRAANIGDLSQGPSKFLLVIKRKGIALSYTIRDHSSTPQKDPVVSGQWSVIPEMVGPWCAMQQLAGEQV